MSTIVEALAWTLIPFIGAILLTAVVWLIHNWKRLTSAYSKKKKLTYYGIIKNG